LEDESGRIWNEAFVVYFRVLSKSCGENFIGMKVMLLGTKYTVASDGFLNNKCMET